MIDNVKQRTLKQNRYRFGIVVNTVLKAMNQELEQNNCEYRLKPEDVDLFIKENALGIAHRIQTSIGEFIIQGKLRNRSTKDFEEAMLQIRCYFDERGIHIPEPNEIDYDIQYADNLSR